VFVLFLIANRAAFKGFFQDDDLDTLGWTWSVPLSYYATQFATPVLSAYNFRPSGHFFYRVLEAYAGELVVTAIVDPDRFPDLAVLRDALRSELATTAGRGP
jgi:hypothetical protein